MRCTPFFTTLMVLCSCSPAVFGYVRLTTAAGSPLWRSDNTTIKYFVNDKVVPGLKNRDDKYIITPDSTPVSALRAAMQSWVAAPNANIAFTELRTTSAVQNSSDKQNVIVFSDSDEVRGALGGAIAITRTFYTVPDGQLIDTDILFNPAMTFSTNGASGTIDIQAVATHELGHALGANHSSLLGATMFQATTQIAPGVAAAFTQRVLSVDDSLFASGVYPASGAPALGTVGGRVSMSDGRAVRGALVTLIDSSAGVSASVLAGSDGVYTIKVPAGSYVAYAEPFNSVVQPANMYLSAASVDVSFQATVLGGAANPSPVAVTAGAAVTADIPVNAGKTGLQLRYFTILPAGATGDYSLQSVVGPVAIASGQAVDMIFVGEGFDGAFLETNLNLFGPGVQVRPGSVHVDPFATVGGKPIVRATVDIAARQSPALATLFLSKGSDSLAVSGMFVITPPQPVFTSSSIANAASGASGMVSAGELVAIYGSNLAATPGMPNAGFDPGGSLPSTLGGATVTFDGVPAPVFYASPGQINLQVPFEVSGKNATQVVVSSNGVASDTITVPVAAATPGIFTYAGGQGPAIVINQDYTFNTEQNPAPRGSVVTIYATGRGGVTYSIQTGRAAPAPQNIDGGGFTCDIGSVSAPVLFGGWTPTSVGLAQVNAQIPVSLPPGKQTVSITLAGASSQNGTYMFVK